MNGLYPWFKVPMELVARKSFWPDIANPTPIRDPWEYMAQQAGLRSVYGNLAGRPMPAELRGPAGVARSWMVYFTDTGEAAYWAARSDVQRWKKGIGLRDPGDVIRLGGGADDLYYWRKALQYDDAEAARKYWNRYAAGFGSLEDAQRGVFAHIRAAHPLSGVPSPLQEAYVKQLTGRELQNYRAAEDWWKKVYQQ
jgi:hypothetical protein